MSSPAVSLFLVPETPLLISGARLVVSSPAFSFCRLVAFLIVARLVMIFSERATFVVLVASVHLMVVVIMVIPLVLYSPVTPFLPLFPEILIASFRVLPPLSAVILSIIPIVVVLLSTIVVISLPLIVVGPSFISSAFPVSALLLGKLDQKFPSLKLRLVEFLNCFPSIVTRTEGEKGIFGVHDDVLDGANVGEEIPQLFPVGVEGKIAHENLLVFKRIHKCSGEIA